MNLPKTLTLAEKFKHLRFQQNLTQRKLAELTGVPKSTIGHIESGKIEVLSSDVFNKLVEIDELSKYALWLLNDHIKPDRIDAMLEFLQNN
jgi:transcriptional regulator with XRE-family HTH domain